MKNTFLIAIAALALSACVSQPAKTLDQKLSEATTSTDRKNTLYAACVNEAEWPILNSSAYKSASNKVKHRIKHRYNAEVKRNESTVPTNGCACKRKTGTQRADSDVCSNNSCKKRESA